MFSLYTPSISDADITNCNSCIGQSNSGILHAVLLWRWAFHPMCCYILTASIGILSVQVRCKYDLDTVNSIEPLTPNVWLFWDSHPNSSPIMSHHFDDIGGRYNWSSHWRSMNRIPDQWPAQGYHHPWSLWALKCFTQSERFSQFNTWSGVTV